MTENATSRGLRVLIVRVGAMGDVLHGLPAAAGLRRALPGVEIGWAVEPHWAPLLRGADGVGPVVDRVHLVPARRWKARPVSFETLASVRGLRAELRARRYDVCVDLQGSVRSAAIGWMAGAGRFVGSAAPREGVAKWLYSERIELTERHVVGQACELAAAALQRPVEAAEVELPGDAEAELWADALLARAGFARFALLVPTAGWGAKEWVVARYGELALRLGESGLGVLVNAAPGRMSLQARELERSVKARVAQATMPQLIALVRRAAVVVGGDTGPVHLAAALGRPVAALFGPTDPARNGPYFPGKARVRVLRDETGGTSYRRSAGTGLEEIGVERVMAAVEELLEDVSG